MKPSYAELEKRVAELERLVVELKAQPPVQQHNHWHAPAYIPAQVFAPNVAPVRPLGTPWITYGVTASGISN